MNKDLPIWVNLVRAFLHPLSVMGDWASQLSVKLIDKHCLCEICKQDGRGGYRK